jgi:hypothetical protein
MLAAARIVQISRLLTRRWRRTRRAGGADYGGDGDVRLEEAGAVRHP